MKAAVKALMDQVVERYKAEMPKLADAAAGLQN
jgi:hypothetical protein